MALPVELRPPLGVALARPASSIPASDGLPGGSRYEPKWDGFRLLAVVDDDETLWSRQGKNLTRSFPELVAALEAQLPRGVVLDGEAVVWQDDRLDFDALLSESAPALHGSLEWPGSVTRPMWPSTCWRSLIAMHGASDWMTGGRSCRSWRCPGLRR